MLLFFPTVQQNLVQQFTIRLARGFFFPAELSVLVQEVYTKVFFLAKVMSMLLFFSLAELSAIYLVQFTILLALGLEHLPIELQRNFTLMRDLDARAQSLMKDIDKLADDYLRNIKKESPEKSKEQITHIQSLFNKAKEYGDDKVQLAIQTYELVDKHIRRLDSDLARFEAEIQDKALNSSRAQEEGNASKKGRKKLKEEKRKKKGNAVSSEDEFKVPRKKQKKGGSAASASSTGAVGSGAQVDATTLGHPADVLDMPVDPNEPTYCLCHQVSYGEMIGCDNPDCPIEWFHFACVGLTTKPKGKWYCPKCTQDRKKK
ncbi:Inhibitor of growth protein 4 [Harpegnathos saltator]|uniref:Inhibitor of growth protein n=1 Tax=Harpegnathos saltator TaxID=610380 RepID=E2BSN1_HARSA|nr:Inhibitor of growth protein 4 [Harpegnathos saltator]